MGNAPTPPPHTPMSLIDAGGMDLSSTACKKALQSVGLDPEQHGNYTRIQKNQRSARQDLTPKTQAAAHGNGQASPSGHVPPCRVGSDGRGQCLCYASSTARELGRDDANRDYLDANGQSGHMCQDSLFRNTGGRNDPCQNIPPGVNSNGTSHGGTFGYNTSRAPCMPHYGRSTEIGSPHNLITQTEASIRQASPTGPFGMDAMSRSVGQMAAVAVTGSRWDYEMQEDGQLRATRRIEAQGADTQRAYSEDQVERATDAQYGASGAAAATSPAQDIGGLSETEKQAIACLVAEWEAGLDTMRQDAQNEHGVAGNGAAQERARAALQAKTGQSDCPQWGNMTDSQQAQAVAARQEQLQAGGAGNSPLASGSMDGNPSRAACREYQANWMWQQTQQQGGLPPMQGYNGSPPTVGTSQPGIATEPLPTFPL